MLQNCDFLHLAGLITDEKILINSIFMNDKTSCKVLLANNYNELPDCKQTRYQNRRTFISSQLDARNMNPLCGNQKIFDREKVGYKKITLDVSYIKKSQILI